MFLGRYLELTILELTILKLTILELTIRELTIGLTILELKILENNCCSLLSQILTQTENKGKNKTPKKPKSKKTFCTSLFAGGEPGELEPGRDQNYHPRTE